MAYIAVKVHIYNTTGAGHNQIRFALDPLAEYLAGLYVVEVCGDNAESWGQFFVQADAQLGAPEAIREFLLAVRDCCLARGADAKVPAVITEELANRAGVEGNTFRLNPA
jgi:hypothetical protein